LVLGDSAFGFSAMELETAARYKFPLKVIIINNNGIAGGYDELDRESKELGKSIPVNALTPNAKYETMS